MENKTQTKLDYIAETEGDGFEFDQKAIENAYLLATEDQSSLAIKLLSIVGGLLATLTFFGFLMIAGLYNSEEGLIVVGVVFIGAAILLNIAYSKLIVDTISVSAYVLGLSLISFGLVSLNMDVNVVSFLMIILSLIVIFVAKSYILSFISVLTISGSFIALITNNFSYDFIHIYNGIILLLLTYVFLHEAKLLASNRLFSKLYDPVRIGLIISFIIGLVLVGKKGMFDNDSTAYMWQSSIITIPIAFYIISKILKVLSITTTKSLIIVYVSSALVLIPTALSPAISGALIIVLLSFFVNYKTGLVIGVVSFIYFISQYYYDLKLTLLVKSIVLFVSGVLFLLFYYFTYKKLNAHAPQEDIV